MYRIFPIVINTKKINKRFSLIKNRKSIHKLFCMDAVEAANQNICQSNRYSNQESEICCTYCTLFQPRKSKKILHKLSILDIQDGIFWKKRANIYKYHVDAMQIARGIIQKTEDTVNTLPFNNDLEIFWCCCKVIALSLHLRILLEKSSNLSA